MRGRIIAVVISVAAILGLTLWSLLSAPSAHGPSTDRIIRTFNSGANASEDNAGQRTRAPRIWTQVREPIDALRAPIAMVVAFASGTPLQDVRLLDHEALVDCSLQELGHLKGLGTTDAKGRIQLSAPKNRVFLYKPGYEIARLDNVHLGHSYQVNLLPASSVQLRAQYTDGMPVDGVWLSVSRKRFASGLLERARAELGLLDDPGSRSAYTLVEQGRFAFFSRTNASGVCAAPSERAGPTSIEISHPTLVATSIEYPPAAPGRATATFTTPWVAMARVDAPFLALRCRMPDRLSRSDAAQAFAAQFAQKLRSRHPDAQLVAVGIPTDLGAHTSQPILATVRFYSTGGWEQQAIQFHPYRPDQQPEVVTPKNPALKKRLVEIKGPDGGDWGTRELPPIFLLKKGWGFEHRLAIPEDREMHLDEGEYLFQGGDAVVQSAIDSGSIQVNTWSDTIELRMRKWVAPIRVHVVDSQGDNVADVAITRTTTGGTRSVVYCAASTHNTITWCVSPKTHLKVESGDDKAMFATLDIPVGDSRGFDVHIQM